MNISVVMIVSGILMFAVSTLFSMLMIDPFHKFYYLFAWYSYIIIVDGINYAVKSDSLIISRTKEFIYMLFLSTGLWFFFEIINVRLENWKYIMLPYDKTERYTGYIFSYATVLPIIFETLELIESLNLFKKVKIKSFKIKKEHLNYSIYLGIMMFFLVLILPEYFFPLIWVCFIFIFEPVNYRIGVRSLLREVSAGRISKFLNLLLTGLIVGFIWEALNYKAGAKWIYTLPYLNHPKLFEMPLAGYLGFPAFAVECYVIYNTLSYFKHSITWEHDSQIKNITMKNYKLFYPLLILTVIITIITAIYLIDKYTVKSFTIF